MEVNIIDYGMNGEGVAKVEGKIVLVEGALIGEIVDVEIITSFKNYSIAKLNKVIVESANRTKPVCHHYGCGGCKLLHFSYSQQLLFKQQLVKKNNKKGCRHKLRSKVYHR